MKDVLKYLLLLNLLLGTDAVSSQERKIHLSSGPPEPVVTGTEPGHLRLSISVPAITLTPVAAEGDSFLRISAEGFAGHGRPGCPDLPEMSRLIEYPEGSRPEVHLLSWEMDTVRPGDHGSLLKIIPVPFPERKDGRPDSAFLASDSLCVCNSPDGTWDAVRFTHAGISRGMAIGRITFSPFSYDPGKNELRILSRIDFEITWPADAEEKYKSGEVSHYNGYFSRDLLSGLRIGNPLAIPASPDKPVKYLILSDTMFRDCLKPFVRWKTRKGFEVIELYRGQDGVGVTREEIKSTLNALYHSATEENPPPAFLLIAGDAEHIPSSQEYGELTDLYYAEYDGQGDYLPDLFYGRFSAADTNDMKVLVHKTLQQEQFLYPDPSFLDDVVLIAGADGRYAEEWGNGQLNYMNRYYFNAEHGNTVNKFLYPDSESQAVEIKAAISRGGSLVNYTGHGYPDRWDNPRFAIGDIGEMDNADKYPLMIGNGCSTGTFDYPECFAEALVRAENKGALAYIGCTNDSYWDEDFYWSVGLGPINGDPLYAETGPGAYDRMFHENREPAEDWYITLGQMVYAGNMAAMTGNISLAKYYWEIYHVFGDPSLIPYFSSPLAMDVLHPGIVSEDAGRITLLAEPRVYGSLTLGDRLQDAGFAGQDGLLTLELKEGISPADTLRITLTGQQRIPYLGEISVLPDSVPYIGMVSRVLYDSSGTPVDQARNGEAFGLGFELANEGRSESGQVFLALHAMDPSVRILQDTSIIGPLTAKEKIQTGPIFRIRASDSLADGTLVPLKLSVTDTAGSPWEHFFRIRVGAPLLQTVDYVFDDRVSGNGNGSPDPAEKGVVRMRIGNQGHAGAANALAMLTDPGGYLEEPETLGYAGWISPGSEMELDFEITLDSSLARGTVLNFPLTVQYSTGRLRDTLSFKAGVLEEGFESGGFRVHPWQDPGRNPWLISGELKYEGTFSARSGPCEDLDTSRLFIDLESVDEDSISFFLRTSTEFSYDFLEFWIDTLRMDRWSGELAWMPVAYPVGPGMHRFRWMYVKDKSLGRGLDAAWIDRVRFPLGSASGLNAGVVEILSPPTGTPLSDRETVRIRVRNFGTGILDSLPVAYRFDDSICITDTIFHPIGSMAGLEYGFAVPLDLSSGGDHSLSVFTSLAGDNYRLNDTLKTLVRVDTVLDAAIGEVVAPRPGRTSFSGYETVSVWMFNRGNRLLHSANLTLRVDGIHSFTEPFHDTLAPGDSLIFTFASTADLSGIGQHSLIVSVDLEGDENPGNNFAIMQYVHQDPSVAEGSAEEPEGILVYPNPGQGRFWVRMPAMRHEVPVRVEVLSREGKMRFSERLPHPPEDLLYLLDLEELEGGIYFLNLRCAGQTWSTPILKE